MATALKINTCPLMQSWLILPAAQSLSEIEKSAMIDDVFKHYQYHFKHCAGQYVSRTDKLI